MRKIEVVVIEAGPDYEAQAVAEAIEAVKAMGYTVIPDDQGGCNAYVSVSGGEDYIAITVY